MRKYDMLDVFDLMKLLLFLLAVVIICMGVYRSCSVGMGKETITRATVTDKGIKRKNSDDLYLVYTETKDGVMVFQITDSLLAGRFNSSDVYAQIKVGKTYDFTTKGNRNTFLE